jgi:hypothetical protein
MTCRKQDLLDRGVGGNPLGHVDLNEAVDDRDGPRSVLGVTHR